MRRLLVIWTARDIPVAQHHFRTLTNTDKLWIYGHTEHEVAHALTKFLTEHDEYEAISFCPDDGLLSQQAYDQIHYTHSKHPEAAISGWCNMDFTHTTAAVQTSQLSERLEYEPLQINDVASRREPFPITWTGMVCLTMTRDLWLKVPLLPYGEDGGFASDHSTCRRLGMAGVEMLCDPLAMLVHIKIDHTAIDVYEDWKRLNLSDKRIELEVDPT